MNSKDLINYLKSDLDRVNTHKNVGFFIFMKYLLSNHSFKICFYLRVTKYFKNKNKFIFYILYFIFKRIQRKYGVQVPFECKIGKGLQFPHYSNIVINSNAIIGDYFTIFQGVTVGSIRGKGSPVIGNNCVFFSGSKVLGNIKIGNNVVVGANAVVIKDVPDFAVVVGIPAKINNYNGEKISNQYLH